MENVCNGRNSDNDSIENALKDAASWCDLALLLLREEREKRHAEVADAQFEYEIKDRDDWMVKADALLASTGYRPPSEEIGNKMTEVLEKAK